MEARRVLYMIFAKEFALNSQTKKLLMEKMEESWSYMENSRVRDRTQNETITT